MSSSVGQEWLVTFTTHEGASFQANCLRLTRHEVAFELNSPAVLRLSEVLGDFRITGNTRTVYSGKAVVRDMVYTGLALVCGATLEDQWLDLDLFSPSAQLQELDRGFSSFLRSWSGLYKVQSDFKVVIADIQSFLTDLRLWLEQLELGIRSSPDGDRAKLQREAMVQLERQVVPAINELHCRFEEISDGIPAELRPMHQIFTRRQLHPYFLVSPFGYRAFHKPLGYAGDYEVVNMIVRDPYEGGSLFAKTMNLWLLRQYPSEAHRNRLAYLGEKLTAEVVRVHTSGRLARVLNLGCGPAIEVQQFIANSPLADKVEFTLIDFNEETIEHARVALTESIRAANRRTTIELQRKSVLQILKESSKSFAHQATKRYDFIYCAGLFDYLTNRTCTQLLGAFHNWAAPGGSVLVTNVDACRPFRHMLEFILDWHLIYRSPSQARALVPELFPAEAVTVTNDVTAVNLFLEMRSPSG